MVSTGVWFLSSQCVWFLEVDCINSFAPSHTETPEGEQPISLFGPDQHPSLCPGHDFLGHQKLLPLRWALYSFMRPFLFSKNCRDWHGCLVPSSQAYYPKDLFQPIAGYSQKPLPSGTSHKILSSASKFILSSKLQKHRPSFCRNFVTTFHCFSCNREAWVSVGKKMLISF